MSDQTQKDGFTIGQDINRTALMLITANPDADEEDIVLMVAAMTEATERTVARRVRTIMRTREIMNDVSLSIPDKLVRRMDRVTKTSVNGAIIEPPVSDHAQIEAPKRKRTKK